MPQDFEVSRQEQLTEKQLKWGAWWVANRRMIRRLSLTALGIFGVALVAYAAWGYYDWFFGTGRAERYEMVRVSSPTITPGVAANLTPEPVIIEDVQVLQSGENRYDLFVRLSNPNHDFWAKYDVEFTAGGSALASASSGFILPSSDRYVYLLGLKSDSYPSGVEVRLADFAWKRVDRHVISPDYLTWAAARLNFSVSDIQFKPPEATESISVSRSSFTVKNDTAFGYRTVGFFVRLDGASGVAGVNYVKIDNFRPGQTRQLVASWFSDLPTVSAVEVVPDVNIFDDGVYLPPGS
jgi:hypothetical protein